MKISVKIVKDSISDLNKRLTTVVLYYPRCIHSELMTHRIFSRNSASSRAVPYNILKDRIISDNFHPIWTYNQKGMKGKVIIESEVINKANEVWDEIRNEVFEKSKELENLNIHKQNINRLLEPFQYIQVLVTSTEWNNFLELRNHPDAQPEIKMVAEKLKEALDNSKPNYLSPGQWHIPFVSNDEIDSIPLPSIHPSSLNWVLDYTMNIALAISVARCARISYNNVDGSKSSIERDLSLYNSLVISKPMHASPAEHQAKVPNDKELQYLESNYDFSDIDNITFNKGKYVSNLEGWIQYRKILEEQYKNK